MIRGEQKADDKDVSVGEPVVAEVVVPKDLPLDAIAAEVQVSSGPA